MNDLMALRDKAKRLIRGSTFCRVLYRNKSPQYFSEVMTSGVMKAYIKDNSGDQASAINGQINGLSFSRVLYRLYRLGLSRLVQPETSDQRLFW